MDNHLVNDSELESTVYDIISEGRECHNLRSCYEFSRFISSKLPQYGYPTPQVRDGIVTYSLEFLVDLCAGTDKEELKNILHTNSQKFDYLETDHSWCEIIEGENPTRIDYISEIELPEGVYIFDSLLLTDVEEDDSRVEYFPIGREFRILNNRFIYNPLCGLKIGPFRFPKIVRLKDELVDS